MPSSIPNRIAIRHLRECIEAIASTNVSTIMNGFQQWFEFSIVTLATIAIDHIRRDTIDLVDNEAEGNIFFYAIVHPSFNAIFWHIEAFQAIQLEQPIVNIAECAHCEELLCDILRELECWLGSMPLLISALTVTRMQPIRPILARYLSGLLEVTQMLDFDDTLDNDEFPWYHFTLAPALHRAVRRASFAHGTFISGEQFKTCVKTGDWSCLEKK
jgi:hypothetical protein